MLTSCSSSIGAIPASVSLNTRIQGPLDGASADSLDTAAPVKSNASSRTHLER